MQPRHSDKALYFREQVFTTREHVIPFIQKCFQVDATKRVLEVGCGEGGNLLPFLELGCHVTGVDLSEGKIELANKFLEEYTEMDQAAFRADDIYALTADETGLFDIIILRDVIEHIHDQEKFMKFIRNFLKEDGVLFFGFPPWYNPFGGHQQICKNKILSKLPYFHLFPSFLYKLVLKTGGESSAKIEALMEIKQTGISIERFHRIVKRNGYVIAKEFHFLINPNYKIKFGMTPRKQSKYIVSLPFIRNLFTTAIYSIIRKKKEE